MKIYLHLLILFSIGYGVTYWAAKPELRRYIGLPFYASYAIIAFVGYVAPAPQYFLATVFLITFATVVDRVDAVCRFLLLTLLLPAVHWRVEAFDVAFTDLSTKEAIGFAVLARMAVNARPNLPRPQGFKPEDALILALAIIFAVAERYPSFTIFIKNLIAQAFLFLLPYYILRNYVRSAAEWRILIAVLAVATAILSVFSIFETFAGWPLFTSMQEASSIAMLQRGGLLRASASMLNPLLLAFVLVAGIVAAVASRSLVRTRFLWQAWVVGIFAGLVMTQSRGNVAALALAAVVFLLLTRRQALALGATLVAGLAGGAIYLGAHSSDRLASFLQLSGGETAGHFDYRGALLDRGVEEGLKHPWFGAEIHEVLTRLADLTQGQQIVDLVNVYLNIFLISGFLGLGVVVALTFFVLRRLSSGYRRIRDQRLLLVRAFAGALFCVTLVELSFMSMIDRVPFVIALALAVLRLVGIERRRMRAQQRRQASDHSPVLSTAAPAFPARAVAV